MCGLSSFWARESVPNYKDLIPLLDYGKKRGTDGVGFSIIKSSGEIITRKFISCVESEKLSKSIISSMNIGDIFISNHRAAPETESFPENDLTIQPIENTNKKIFLVHNGSVSNKIYKELEKTHSKQSLIDSEAIIWAYLENEKNMKKTMEYLSGGFAFLLIDKNTEKLFSVCSHNPLWSGYVKGYGMIFSSMKNGILETISALKNTTIEKNNICVWEDYYCRQMPENSISEIDLDSGMINEYEFQPRYFHPNWDSYHREDRENSKVLVSASGGLDSSTTLSVLKAAELDITAVHFHYGHRGEDAEWCAIQNICDILNIPLTSFDISKNMKLLDSSMLTDPKHKITTGTENDLKTTIAWTCARNVFFVTYMGALAESLIIKDYDNVYITGGFMNLTESGVYPDNSERFIEAFDKFITLGSIVGSRIKSLYGLSNILKTEQYILLDALDLLDTLSPWLISCDRPIVKKGIPYNCSKDGEPACGSGGLSYWACNRAGLEDKRRYYEVDDKDYKLYTPPSNIKRSLAPISEIINKIQIPEINKEILRRKLLKE